MPSVEPVIFEFHARQSKFVSDLRGTTRTVDRELGTQEKRVRMLEQQFQRSSGQISSTLKGLAGTLATAFTGRELINLVDTFTRFQNSLRVAGLEGAGLAATQEKLFALAQQYGVELESVGTLYSRAAQSADSLQASEADLLAVTEAVSASLRISGISATEAQGALLQLGQAFGSSRIQAEEYNSLIDSLRPLLKEAAKFIDGTGGSLDGLTRKIKDTNGAGVTNIELMRGIVAALGNLKDQAASADGTISQAFTNLRNALTLYIGEADKANGASAAVAAGIQKLADNIDVLIPAIAILAANLGGRFVASAFAGGTALRAISAHATIATTSLAGTALAARSAGAALLTALGGPVGVAITAVAAGLILVANNASTAEGRMKAIEDRTKSTADAARDAAQRLDEAGVATDSMGRFAAGASGKVAGLSRNLSEAAQRASELTARLKELGIYTDLQNNLGRQNELVQRINRNRGLAQEGERRRGNPFLAQTNSGQAYLGVANQVLQDERELRLLRDEQDALEARAEGVRLAIENGVDLDGSSITPTAVATPAKPARSPSPRAAASGPTSSDIAARQADEIARLQAEELQARIQLTSDAEDRAQLQRELLEIERDQRIRQIEGDKELSGQEKAAQIEIIRNLYGVASQVDEQGRIVVEANKSLYAQQIAQDEQAEVVRRGLQLSTEINRTQQDLLSSQAALVDDREERARLERSILDLQHEQERNELRASIAQLEIAGAKEAELAAAKRRLALIEEVQANERESLDREYESPLQRYRRLINKTDGQLQDQAEQAVVDEIESVRRGMRDGLAEAIGTDDPFIKGLLDILIEQVLLRPIADALASATAAGSAGLGPIFGIVSGLIGSIFGRASGGYVGPGQVVRVNEGASPGRVEGFVGPSTGGQIVPLGRMAAAQPTAQVPATATVRLELSGDIDARIQKVSGPVAVEVVRGTAPALVDAAASETIRRVGRPSL